MKKSFYLPGLLFAFLLLSSLSSKAVYITVDPHNDTACSGSRVKFFITDTGAAPITRVWQISTDGGVTWSNLRDTLEYTGSATDTLRIHTDMSLNNTWYRAIATNTFGADTSGNALLVVDTTAGPILGANAVCHGSTATLSDAVPNGMWSSILHSVDTISAAGAVYGVSYGFDTVKYTVVNSCGTSVSWVRMRVDTVAPTQPIVGPTATCVGHSIVLTNANNLLGVGTWSTSNGNAAIAPTGTLTGVAGGTDIVSYVFTTACNSDTSTLSVTIDTMIAHGTISGASGVCAGSWIPLTETVTGGLWISSNTAVAIVDAAGHVTGISQGTATVSYYFSNGCGASVATHTVTVAEPANPIGGLDSVGIGNMRTFTNAVAGGMWFSSDTSKLTIDTVTGMATGIAAGTAIVTYQVTNICGTTTATLLVYVGTAPSAGSLTTTGSSTPGSVCLGSSITMVSTVPGGVWHIKGSVDTNLHPVDTFAHAIISSTGVITDTIAGQDTVYYTVTNGFGSTTISYLVTVLHTPIISLIGPSVIALGGAYTIVARPADGVITLSNSKGSIISHYDSTYGTTAYNTNIMVIMLTQGNDTLHYHVTNMCGSADSIFVLSIPVLNVPKIESAGALNSYPNPTNGEFILNLESDKTEEAKVAITNVAGQVVRELTIETNKNVDIKLNEPAGLYFISAKTAESSYSCKITIK